MAGEWVASERGCLLSLRSSTAAIGWWSPADPHERCIGPASGEANALAEAQEKLRE